MSNNSFISELFQAAKDEEGEEGKTSSSEVAEASLLPCSPRRRRQRKFMIPSATSRSLSFGKEDDDEEVEANESETQLGESKMGSSSSSTVTPRKGPLSDAGDDATKKGSLFGTVMQRARHSDNDDQQQQASFSDDAFDPLQSTPSRFRPSNANLGLLTPGGFSLMNLLKSANSPFAKAAAANNNNNNMKLSSPEDGDHENESTTNMGDWDEAACGRDHLDVLDWSLKCRLRLEGSPSNSLLSLPRIVGAHGMQRFMSQPQQNLSSSKSSSSEIRDESSTGNSDECDLQWQSALLYWQYPSCHQNNKQANAGSDGPQQHSKKRLRSASSNITKIGQENAKPIADSRLESQSKTFSNRPPTETLKKDQHGTETKMTAALFKTRLGKEQREWQEAFWSLFRQWQHTITCQLDATHGNRDNKLTAHDFSKSSFYAMGSHQTVLFRLGKMADGEYIPMVVMSSTTTEMRDKLRSMNVKLRCLDSLEGPPGQEYQDRGDPHGTQCSSKSHQKAAGGDSPLVKRELELLRKAQASGETVGANVSFKWNKNSGHDPFSMKDRRRDHPPLYVAGMDDCLAFFEIYLNTLGFSRTSANDLLPLSQSPPFLCCRHLGPFLHSNLQTLRVSSRRIRTPSANVDQQTSVPSQAPTLMDVLEVSGTILPCAYNEIMCSAIQKLVFDAPDDATTALAESTGGDRAHHLVLYAKPTQDEYEGVQNAPTATSAMLNGISCSTSTESSSCAGLACVKECGHGHCITVAVWDAVRPDAIAFKTDLVMPLL